jgi:hypothetical protein
MELQLWWRVMPILFFSSVNRTQSFLFVNSTNMGSKVSCQLTAFYNKLQEGRGIFCNKNFLFWLSTSLFKLNNALSEKK